MTEKRIELDINVCEYRLNPDNDRMEKITLADIRINDATKALLLTV